MEVKVGNRTYTVEFVTLAKNPKYGRDKRTKIVVQTDCVIRNGSKVVLSRGSATQNYRDELRWHNGRKFALARALEKRKFNKGTRSIFWKRYKAENLIKGP